LSKYIKNFIRKLSLLLAVTIVAAMLFAAPGVNPAGAVGAPINNAVQYLYSEYITNGPDNSDGGVGAYALYLLMQAGVDVSTWEYDGTSLDDAVISAINDDLSDPDASAKRLAQDLAAADALGEDGLADDLLDELLDRESSSGFDGNAYSDIPAFDLLGRTGYISVIDEVYAKDYILAAQETTVSDAAYGSFGGGWGPDFMVTAQAVRALHYLDPGESDSEIQDAIDEALGWLEAQQQDDGSFTIESWGYWDDKVIDTPELIVALDALGLDPAVWESGSGSTAVDYMMDSALNDDGSFGTSKNVMDATWALCAYNALDEQGTLWRFYLEPAGADIKVGETKQMSAVWQNADGSADVTADAQWSAADSSIASIGSSGLVTAQSAGETQVSAFYDGLTASAGVTVNSVSPGGGSVGTEVTVGLAVVGMDNELLYGPSNLSVDESNEWGLTALGALDASGISYDTSSWAYGDFVEAIDGQANSGLAGWMYTANGVSPAVGADQYEIEEDDEIIFYYSESMDQAPPQWDNLEDLSAAALVRSADLPDPVSDSDLNTALRNAGSAGQVALQVDDDEAILALSSDQISKILSKDVPLAVTIQGVQFILSPDSLEVPELLSEDAAMLQFEVLKLSGDNERELAEPLAASLKLAGEIYELNIQVVNEDGTLQHIEQFPGCMVLLPVPAGLEEAAAAGMLMAFWYNEGSRSWEEVGGAYNAADGTVGFDVAHFSKYALLETIPPPEVKTTFTDIAGHWAQAEIEHMAARGCVSGVGANEFAPEARITRAEFASILARMAGLADNNGAAERFSDVPANAWYRGMVGAAATAGLVCGTSENSFAPDVPVTREQMAAMLVRFMNGNGAEAVLSDAGAAEQLAGFSDAAGISPWACSPVAQAVRDGLMLGRESGLFVPLGDATRAEATVVLCRALQKLPQPGK
jgi:hypothetical protein